MRQWYPATQDETLEQVYADLPPPDRDRWVAIGMVASVDGAVAVDGVSGALGHRGDLAAFRALRDAADVLLVGAGTARAERYGPPKITEARTAARIARGQRPAPVVAVVSRSLELDAAGRLFDPSATDRPCVVTCAAAPAVRRTWVEERATVVEAGQDDVDLAAALSTLAEQGLGRVVVEGGPRLNGALLAQGLVDEVFVTLAPWLVGQAGVGIAGGGLGAPVSLTLREGRVHGDEVLLRYAVEPAVDH